MWMTHCALLVSAAASENQPNPGERPVTPADSTQEAHRVVTFWKDAGPRLWFAKDEDFDRCFRDRFAAEHDAAACGDLDAWLATAEGALSLCLLLDQYPRNAFRGTKRMYATDEKARKVANHAVLRGYDLDVEPSLSVFIYLPFSHSEDLADQHRAVAFCHRLGQPNLKHAEGHRDIVRRFGRFPHRNPILGRSMTPEEQRFLDEGGYSG